MVEAKPSNSVPTFAPIRFGWLLSPTPKVTRVAEAAREDVNLIHVPEPWCCYRTVSLHLPHPHHQCVSASRSDFSCLYPYFTYSCSQETCTRDWLTLGGTYTPWYGKEPKDFQSLLVNNRCRPTELSKTLIQKIK